MRCIKMPCGLFSPRSNSLRTTVISEIRSSRLTKLLTRRSASSLMPNSRFSSVAGLAVALVPRADQDRHVDGDRRPRRRGEEQYARPVRQAVLGHAFDGGNFL